MVVPAAIFVAFNAGGAGSDGWGIPMATDIAFAVGVVTLLGKRVPLAAKVFLLTLAVADDIGAIVVIAVFYTGDLALGWFAAALVGLGVIFAHAARRRAVPRAVPRGRRVHLAGAARVGRARHPRRRGPRPADAGVAAALAAPLPGRAPARVLDRIDKAYYDRVLTNDGVRGERAAHRRGRPAGDVRDQPARAAAGGRWRRGSAYVIVPVFALANAGVQFSGDAVSGLFSDPVVLGVSLGLVVGKTVGVFAASVIAVKLGLGRLPAGATWRHIFGLAICAGVGFTVALFVTSISFTDPALADSAKIGILLGSAVAGTVGYLFLRAIPAAEPPRSRSPRRRPRRPSKWTVRPAARRRAGSDRSLADWSRRRASAANERCGSVRSGDVTGTLILLRHGQSLWNAENLFTGWWDADLSEKGEAEARAAGSCWPRPACCPT